MEGMEVLGWEEEDVEYKDVEFGCHKAVWMLVMTETIIRRLDVIRDEDLLPPFFFLSIYI